jgi:hypothetical protein
MLRLHFHHGGTEGTEFFLLVLVEDQGLFIQLTKARPNRLDKEEKRIQKTP